MKNTGGTEMINRAVLTGRLTKDPDLKYTSSSTAVVSFTLAVSRKFTNQQGEREADFINCTAWRKTAETLANYTHKGSLIGIDGRIQTRSYDNQQGKKVFVTEIVADSFSFLESKKDQSNNSNNEISSFDPDIDGSMPF
jgi:single-strand DNA-binding protein